MNLFTKQVDWIQPSLQYRTCLSTCSSCCKVLFPQPCIFLGKENELEILACLGVNRGVEGRVSILPGLMCSQLGSTYIWDINNEQGNGIFRESPLREICIKKYWPMLKQILTKR